MCIRDRLLDSAAEAALLEAQRQAAQRAFWVPMFISLSDVMQGLAAGMTIKFFPIFFMDEVCTPSFILDLASSGDQVRCSVLTSGLTCC